MAVSFSNHIRPLFRDDIDVESMKAYGMDLSSYDDVKKHAAEILRTVDEGSMPCDMQWMAEQVALFQQWMDDGMNP